jgi:hypothetical protein
LEGEYFCRPIWTSQISLRTFDKSPLWRNDFAELVERGWTIPASKAATESPVGQVGGTPAQVKSHPA